jgi:hypothetical protein
MENEELVSETELKLKDTQDMLNEQIVENTRLKDENEVLSEEVKWISQQYNDLYNYAFNEVYDLSTRVKARSLATLLYNRKMSEKKENP